MLFTNKTDYELFSQYLKNPSCSEKDRKTAITTLWLRYEPLTHKMGHLLNARKYKGKFYGLEADTYYSDYYDAFLKAINNVKLDKIRVAKNTWKFWICYNGYLRSAGRDKINNYVSLTKNEKPIMVQNQDGDDVLITDMSGDEYSSSVDTDFNKNEESIVLREVIKNVYKSFNDKQKRIWDMRAKGETLTTIAKASGVSSSSIKYQLDKIKGLLKNELSRVNSARNTDVTVSIFN